jgi:hypothetical protein
LSAGRGDQGTMSTMGSMVTVVSKVLMVTVVTMGTLSDLRRSPGGRLCLTGRMLLWSDPWIAAVPARLASVRWVSATVCSAERPVLFTWIAMDHAMCR